MTNRSALALAFATGYVVGRSRTKLPLGMGGALLARRLGVDPVGSASSSRRGPRSSQRPPAYCGTMSGRSAGPPPARCRPSAWER
ncbi:hypothetical protein LUW77_06415 [Streptomyces radiopugnans]|nr:hypothetical protein LUW77_06415 [Streptomyces radiopugnans]